MGEPVNLRDYFSSPEVREYYKQLKSNRPDMPTLNEFMNNIDEYQSNLGLAKPPAEPKPENPTAQDYPNENIPVESNHPESSADAKIAPDGTRLPNVLHTAPR